MSARGQRPAWYTPQPGDSDYVRGFKEGAWWQFQLSAAISKVVHAPSMVDQIVAPRGSQRRRLPRKR